MKYPDGKDFIFTIFDDTDVATLDYIQPIYDFLNSIQLKTTKSVWPLSCEVDNKDNDYTGSHTLEDARYADYIRTLLDRGFEIGFHGASMMSSDRKNVKRSLDFYADLLGVYPATYAPHSLNRENLYWGQSRFSFRIFKYLYKAISHENKDFYQGHAEKSKFFWGDYSLKYLNYVRNFTYDEINLLNISRSIPYANHRQPYVKNWFFSCDADNVEEFNRLLNSKNQDRLERERGVCILSTHFGKGFLRNGYIHEETSRLLKEMSERNGWFVPVGTALDFLSKQRPKLEIGVMELFKLEFYWFLHSLKRRNQTMAYEKTEVPYLTAARKATNQH